MTLLQILREKQNLRSRIVTLSSTSFEGQQSSGRVDRRLGLASESSYTLSDKLLFNRTDHLSRNQLFVCAAGDQVISVS